MTEVIAKVVLTTAQKIEALCEKAAALITQANELQAGLDREQRLANVAVGDVVSFDYGRKENRATLTGSVIVVYENETGKRVKVLAGEGVDAKLLDLKVSDLSSIDQSVADLDADEAQAVTE